MQTHFANGAAKCPSKGVPPPTQPRAKREETPRPNREQPERGDRYAELGNLEKRALEWALSERRENVKKKICSRMFLEWI